MLTPAIIFPDWQNPDLCDRQTDRQT